MTEKQPLMENASFSKESYSEEGTKRGRKLCNASVLKLAGGSVCIVAAIASWVIMAEKLQKLNQNYPKPYFLTYWVHSSYAVMYILWTLWRVFPGKLRCNSVGGGAFPDSKRLVILGGVLALISMISAWLWYLSLTKTNIPANTSIYQSTAAIVFIVSVPCLGERVTVLKVVSVFLSIIGVTVVSIFSSKSHCATDSTNMTAIVYNESSLYNATILGHLSKNSDCVETSTPLGYVEVLFSVILYAVFEVSYKKFGTGKDDPAAACNGVRMLGYMGVHTILWLWPPILVFHFSGFEPFELPTGEFLGLMFMNAFLDIVFNVSLLISIALVSPLFTSVGTILAIPASVLVDWMVQGYLLSFQSVIGILIIIMGFGGFMLSEFVAARREAKGPHNTHLQIDSLSGEDTPLLGDQKRPLGPLILKYLL